MTRRQPFEPLTTTNFDTIVVGTGLAESILAASLAIAGASVLHLDPNAFYGSTWSTLSLAQLTAIFDSSTAESARSTLHDLPTSIPPIADGPDHPEPLVLPDIPQHARLFPRGFHQLLPSIDPSLLPHLSSVHIDLTPRPTMAAAPLIDVLVRTNVGHYLDFRPLSALYLDFAAPSSVPTPHRVPASRSDIFQHRLVTPIEKRLLARFVKACLPPDPIATPHAPLPPKPPSSHDASADPSETFADAMAAARLTPTLQRFLRAAVLFSDAPQLPASTGRAALARFHESMRRYATPTPFLYPNYGGGELAQAFCRLCAVHGGTYVLRRGAAAIIPHVGVITAESELVRARHVFLGSEFLAAPSTRSASTPHSPLAPEQDVIWRFAGVLSGSILAADHPPRCMLVVPDEQERAAVWLRQLDPTVMVCPSPFVVLYGETVAGAGEDVLLRAIRRYVSIGDDRDSDPEVDSAGDPEAAAADDELISRSISLVGERETGAPVESARASRRPRLLWGVTYARPDNCMDVQSRDGFETVRAPERGNDIDEVLSEAERCFRTVYPDGEFFPERQANILSEDLGDADEGVSSAGNGVADTASEGNITSR